MCLAYKVKSLKNMEKDVANKAASGKQYVKENFDVNSWLAYLEDELQPLVNLCEADIKDATRRIAAAKQRQKAVGKEKPAATAGEAPTAAEAPDFSGSEGGDDDDSAGSESA